VIKIGCCGFQKSRKEYFKNFKLVEIQETFYNIVPDERLKMLRMEAPHDFEFTVKCFQGVSHPPSSPTWKRSNVKPSNEHGSLKPTKAVFESWEKTLNACKILKAKICLIQLPSSFRDTEENINNAKKFFYEIVRDEIKIAVELRGWKEEYIKALCEEFDLIHCTDLFASEPRYLSSSNILYTRLHGSPPGKKMYSYKYSIDDLKVLKTKITDINASEKYILFNNIFMYEDALSFSKLL